MMSDSRNGAFIAPPHLPKFQGLRRISYTARVLKEMQGQFPRECSLCGFAGRFLPAGRPPRYDAKCPRCMSVERHRLFALGDRHQELVPPGARVLHFAPEPALAAYLKSRAAQYASADIQPGRADLTLDVERLDVPDGRYDVIVASHILEHVDDAKALRELRRVLSAQGQLVVGTPVIDGWDTTYEKADVVTEQDRLLHFGQEDHVRYYGRDVTDRITAGGFTVEALRGTAEECVRYGLIRGEALYLCRKS